MINIQKPVDRFWNGSISSLPMRYFHTAICFAMWLYFLPKFFAYREWITAQGFHLPPHLFEKMVPLTLPLLPESFALIFILLFSFSIVAMALFPSKKVFVLLCLSANFYVFHADPITSVTSNKLFIASLLILLLSPDYKNSNRMPAWPMRMLQLTLVITYFGNGLVKLLPGDWLIFDTLHTIIQGRFRTPLAAWLNFYLPTWAWFLIQLSTLVFEILAPILFFFRKTRPIAIVFGLGLHFSIAVLMKSIFYFSITMACFYIFFVSHKTLNKLSETKNAMVALFCLKFKGINA